MTDEHDAATVPTYAELKAQRDALLEACRATARIIEETYEHDDQGNRVEGDSPASGADIVDLLCMEEGMIFDAIALAEGTA